MTLSSFLQGFFAHALSIASHGIGEDTSRGRSRTPRVQNWLMRVEPAPSIKLHWTPSPTRRRKRRRLQSLEASTASELSLSWAQSESRDSVEDVSIWDYCRNELKPWQPYSNEHGDRVWYCKLCTMNLPVTTDWAIPASSRLS